MRPSGFYHFCHVCTSMLVFYRLLHDYQTRVMNNKETGMNRSVIPVFRLGTISDYIREEQYMSRRKLIH